MNRTGIVSLRELEDHLLAVLIAFWTNVMRWLNGVFRFFQAISENTTSDTLKLIALLFGLPFFKASYLCFQLAYALGEIRFARVRSRRVRLGIEHQSRKVRYLRGDHSLIPDVFDRFRDIKRALDTVNRQFRFS